MKLPQGFKDSIEDFFSRAGIPLDGFYESFDTDGEKGIRINRLKVSEDGYEKILSDLSQKTDPVTWCSSGFYTDGEPSGNDPYYHAGVYYPQEPSAMLPGEVMNVKPGDTVLDLCAAPGGKAVRMGEDLQGEGLLIANEINANRAKALLRNIERMGIENCIILNETPEKLADKLYGFFDKILIDAPCSGEGMFRRDPNAVKSWERFGPETCIPMQKDILDSADIMLKTGGELVYSTCTFCEGEDELQIKSFMERHPGYRIVPHPEIEGVTHMPDGSMRILPHVNRGDGHFCVHLIKESGSDREYKTEKLPAYKMKRSDNYGFGKSREAMMSFLKDILTDDAYSHRKERYTRDFMVRDGNIHIMPLPEQALRGLKTVKTGLYPGEIKTTSTERLFVPSHSFALTLRDEEIREDRKVSLKRDDERLMRYLKGETIDLTEVEKAALVRNGYIVLEADVFPVGLGKVSSDGKVKNLYPKAWRIM